MHPGFGTAGSFNVSVQYEGVLRGGRPLVATSAYRYDRTTRPYMYQTYPEVTSVSPSNGSVAGGTLVTIVGRGFPSLDLGLGDTLAVRLYGVPCTVLSSNHTTVTCRSGPAPASPPLSYAVALKGLYPGMRGAEYELYRNTSAGEWSGGGSGGVGGDGRETRCRRVQELGFPPQSNSSAASQQIELVLLTSS